MITPHLDLKVGLSDTKSQVFSFLFVFPFGKAPPSATNSHEQQAALSLYLKRKLK